MRILNSPHALAHEARPVALAAGFFDGVHVGHRKVIDATIARARQIGGQAWALTFDPHPLAVLAPDRRPPLLTSTVFRLERLAAAGLDGCLLMAFTPELAHHTPAQFVHDVLCVDGWHPESVLAGDNWRFGAGGRGTVHTLTQLSEGRIHAIVVPPAIDGGEIVSSTRIRNAILAGDVTTAARLLGSPYRMRARVVHGRGIGHQIGFATANLVPNAEVLPPHGIYALWAGIDGGIHRAVCDFGTGPTFQSHAIPAPVIEVHVLDFDGDLYDREIDIAFVGRLRDEVRFDSKEELVAQIREDVTCARSLLIKPPPDLFPHVPIIDPSTVPAP